MVNVYGHVCGCNRATSAGKKFYCTPSDSVALIAASAADAIPYFKGKLKGVARSMPTSEALDR